MKKALYVATIDMHIKAFHLPYLKLLHDNGYEVHVATKGDEKFPNCDVKHQICIDRSPYSFKNLKAIKELRKIIEKEKFDIIHCHTPMGSVVTRLAARKARKKYHTRVIYTAHGFHFYKGSPKLNWILFYPIEKWLAKYTDTLITINTEDYNLAKKKFSKRCHDIQYVPGVGIDTKKFDIKMTSKEKKELKKSLGLKEKDYVLTCVARLDKNKNQGFLIEVIEQLVKDHKDIHLLLVGPDELNGCYQKMVEDKNLKNNVHFLGFREDIPELLAVTDIVVSASLREGLPVNVMEALAASKPVVALKCRGMKDLIKNGNNGYIVSNVKDFKNNIIKIRKKAKINDIIKTEDYDIKSISSKLNTVYNKKIKIIHLLASNSYSGAENVVCTIIKNMDNKRYDMYYCSPYGSIQERLKEENIRYIPLKKLSYREIKKTINNYKPNIIHAHDNRATVISSLFYKKSRIVSHIHGNNQIMNKLNLKTLLFNIASKKIEKFIWVSDSSLNDYFFKKKIEEKSIVLYNIIDSEQIIKKSKEYKINEKFDIIYLGRLAYPKNPERFIEIIKLIKEKKRDIKVAMVGDGTDKGKIEKLISKYKLKENVEMFGFQSNPYPILKASKILVMTSIYEGTPMCVLEAQALGKPVIATPVDGLKKIIKNNKNGYLCSRNNVIVSKIEDLLFNKDIYNTMSIKAKEFFSVINDKKVYLYTLTKLYEK